MRSVKEFERIIIAKMAQKLPVNSREKLLSDFQGATVLDEVDNGSRVIFAISDYRRPPYRGQHPYPVEGRMLDKDDVELEIVLYADENGRLLELEFIRWGEGVLKGPKLETLEVR